MSELEALEELNREIDLCEHKLDELKKKRRAFIRADNTTLLDLGLDAHVLNPLFRQNIRTVGDVFDSLDAYGTDGLLAVRSFGETYLERLLQTLIQQNYHLPECAMDWLNNRD